MYDNANETAFTGTTRAARSIATASATVQRVTVRIGVYVRSATVFVHLHHPVESRMGIDSEYRLGVLVKAVFRRAGCAIWAPEKKHRLEVVVWEGGIELAYAGGR